MNRPDFSWSSAPPTNDIQKRVMSDICKANGCLATCRTLKDMDKEIKEAEAQALITGHEGAESVGAREAAAVDARARRRAEVEEQYAPKIGTVLAAKDYAAADSLREDMEARIKDEEAAAASLQEEMAHLHSPWAAGHGRIAGAKADVHRGRAGVHRKGS